MDWYECVIEEFTDKLVESGSITVAYNQGVRRSCSLTIYNEYGETAPSPNSRFWYTKKFKLWSGIEDPWTGDIFWFPCGVYLTTSVSINGNHISISGVDKFGLFTSEFGASVLEAEHRIDNGKSIATAIRDILQMGLGNNRVCDPVEPLIDVSLYSETVPYDISVSGGQYMGDILIELALCMGADIYYDGDGVLNVHRGTTDTSYSTKGAQWVFEKNDANTASLGTDSDLSTAINIVTVTGTDKDDLVYYYTAANTNPSSPLSIEAVGKRAADTIETDAGYSTQRCKEYAEYWVHEKSIIALSVSIECIFLPHLDVNKIIMLINPQTDSYERYIVTEITMPFGGTSNMTLGVTNTVDLPYYNEI